MAEGRSLFRIEKLSNGITLLGEEMPHVASAALSVLLPVGAATDPAGLEGSATVLAEMLGKGAGPWNARELSQQFEDHGIHRSHSAGVEVSLFTASMLGEKLPRALELFHTLLLEPRLPDDELASVRELALQDLEALEDEPASKVMTELAGHFYPGVYGRSQLGTTDGVTAISIASLRQYYRLRFVPERVVIAVAGRFQWESFVRDAERLFGSWAGSAEPLPPARVADKPAVHHVSKETSQVQIALAYPSVSFGDPDFYTARVGVNVLSGGMAGRLFIEVREKRGLVYRVGASHSAAKGRGAVFGFAGTTPENARECLTVMLNELRGLSRGVSDDELARAKADLKSRVVMQTETSGARASALVNDWWNLGRLRTLDEIKGQIDRVTSDDIVQHMLRHPVGPVTLVTLGPAPIDGVTAASL